MGWDSKYQEHSELRKLQDAVKSAEFEVEIHEKSAQYHADKVHEHTVKSVEAEGKLKDARHDLDHHLKVAVYRGMAAQEGEK